MKDVSDAIDNSFFAKAEYQWWNVKDFSNLKCQNATNNGCGGYGNNWYELVNLLKFTSNLKRNITTIGVMEDSTTISAITATFANRLRRLIALAKHRIPLPPS